MSTTHHAVLGIFGVEIDCEAGVSITLDMEGGPVLETSEPLPLPLRVILACVGNNRKEEQRQPNKRRKNSNNRSLETIFGASNEDFEELVVADHQVIQQSNCRQIQSSQQEQVGWVDGS